MLRKKYLTFIIAITVLVLYIATTAFFLVIRKPSQRPGIEPTETPFPTIVSTPATRPLVNYDKKDSQRLLDVIKNRKRLSAQDAAARASLIAGLDNTSGILAQTKTFKLEYVKAADGFIAEILTIDILQAKIDTASWLNNNGLSYDGICHLPLSFYLNRNIASQLGKIKYTFSPLPEGC